MLTHEIFEEMSKISNILKSNHFGLSTPFAYISSVRLLKDGELKFNAPFRRKRSQDFRVAVRIHRIFLARWHTLTDYKISFALARPGEPCVSVVSYAEIQHLIAKEVRNELIFYTHKFWRVENEKET